MAEPRDLFVGIDGGGTKTRAVILDERAAVLAEKTGPASTLALSADTAWRVIADMVTAMRAALPAAGQRLHWGIGLAGTEFSDEYARFETLVPEAATLQVVSDAHAACVGAHAARDGAIVAVGTGIVGYRICTGVSRRASGWGFPQDDRGSGAWIGLDAISATLRALDGRREASALTADIGAGFDGRADRIVAWAARAGAADFAAFARRVAAHADSKDPLAIEILARAGREVAQILDALLIDCPADLALALVGGLAATLTPFLPEPYAARRVAPACDAAYGAALMALAGAGHVSRGSSAE